MRQTTKTGCPMGAKTDAPVIIKRKKIVVEEGHHGGAWKVAYADFVTAMMAFFMLMWLLNATTEKQRKGLADFFNPTVPITRASGGGDHALGGNSVFTLETLNQMGRGGVGSDQAFALETALLEDLDQSLTAIGGESMVADDLQRHILTRVTDHGLIVEIFDLPERAMFDGDTATPTALLKQLIQPVAQTFGLASNRVAVGAHIHTRPIVETPVPGWTLTTARANAVRGLLIDAGLNADRVVRVVGHADKSPATEPVTDLRNSRVELILLRSDPAK